MDTAFNRGIAGAVDGFKPRTWIRVAQHFSFLSILGAIWSAAQQLKLLGEGETKSLFLRRWFPLGSQSSLRTHAPVTTLHPGRVSNIGFVLRMIDPVLDPSHDVVDRRGGEGGIPKSVTDGRHDVRRARRGASARAEFGRLGKSVVGQVSPSV